MKNERHLERIMKGVANHRRIAILSLLSREPELSVEDISERFDVHMKTTAEHIRRLAQAVKGQAAPPLRCRPRGLGATGPGSR